MRKYIIFSSFVFLIFIILITVSRVNAQTNTTQISFVFLLHGIGSGGDNSNRQASGNLNPVTESRPLIVEIFNNKNILVSSLTTNIQYLKASGVFSGSIEGQNLTTGDYTIRVYTPKYLKKQLNGIVHVTENQNTTVSPAALIAGDATDDNRLDILDYNHLVDCFSELIPAKNCADNTKKFMADLTDDGKVNQNDYNLFLRELAVQGGDIDPTPGGILPTLNPTNSPTVTKTPTNINPSPTTISPSITPGQFGAFPGAVGFGRNTKGGRGGKVMYVTNLNDSGAGSLRECVASTGPRTCVFKVAGTISLQKDLGITQPYLTIAGQSAPGQGVQIKGGMIKIETHDVILRYLKVRKGNPTGGNPSDTDSVSLSGNNVEVYNVIIDHSTMIWGTDIGGMAILTNSHDVTVQDSILGEGLYLSDHAEGTAAQGGHSMSLNLTQLNDSGYPTRITLYRNLITSSDSRNPQMIQPANVDFINNVIYNWGAKSAYGNPKSLNLVNNYYVKGPLSKTTDFWNLRVDADYPTQNNNAVYENGNIAVGFTGTRGGPASIYSASPRFTSSIANPTTALNAYNYIVANAGAIKPLRDSVDQRIISNLTTKSMKLPNGAVANRFINDTDLVWPNLTGGNAPVDSDNDGMADDWEQSNFGSLTRGSAANTSSDFDADGYTDLEEYLNETNPKIKN